jgi:formiminotetrahydrofolate cyclodeaminase
MKKTIFACALISMLASFSFGASGFSSSASVGAILVMNTNLGGVCQFTSNSINYAFQVNDDQTHAMVDLLRTARASGITIQILRDTAVNLSFTPENGSAQSLVRAMGIASN